MSASGSPLILKHDAPGETRAVLIGADGRACRLFLERWNGAGEPARFGSTHPARLRRFADDLRGAFVELQSGEEAFLRLKDRKGLTEGAALTVEVISEVRTDKLARVRQVETAASELSGFDLWRAQIASGEGIEVEDDGDAVDAAFEAALTSSVTLPGGGQLHIDRTRALTVFDVDTSGRSDRGSAGARALKLNKEAASEMARQVASRGLGGLLVVDCVSPLNQAARDQIRTAAQAAFGAYGIDQANVLKPSALGLLEASVPWRECPLEDRLAANPGETELLCLLADVQREAAANPTDLFKLSLSKLAGAAYLSRKADADAALQRHFGRRVSVETSTSDDSKVDRV